MNICPMKNSKYLFIFLLCCFSSLHAQNPAPASGKASSILFRGADIHVGNGKVISSGVLLMRDGKIVYAGNDETEAGKADSTIDCKGMHIYPGLIAANTIMGLSEIEAARATNDFNEVGNFNPGTRSLIAYNTDSKVSPTVRSNGVMLIEAVPQGGIISGTSSVMCMDGWNWEDAVYASDIGVHMNWPGSRVYLSGEESENRQRENYEKRLRLLEQFMKDAQSYCKSGQPAVTNTHFEAMREVFSGKKKLFIHASYVKDIVNSINYISGYNITPVLVEAQDAWMVTDLLREKKVSVILGRSHSLPAREDEDIDQPFKTPAILKQAGIPYCISVDGFWQVRNLSYNAGTAAAHGLGKEEALSAITLHAAGILGIAERCGSLEPGKDANILLTEGDILDMKSSRVKRAWLRGMPVSLDNIQEQLYRKYCRKYGLKP
jgi:imidazolonepropionase-like amidohydrolase